MKSVFFGPFIGEFGWEVLYWSAYINKLCLTKFKGYKVYVASYPGRELFYPQADVFLSHPPFFTDLNFDHNGYITDEWINGYPRGNASETINIFGLPIEKWSYTNEYNPDANFSTEAKRLLDHYLPLLPKDCEIICPFFVNNISGFKFGVDYSAPSEIKQFRVPFVEQAFFQFKPKLFTDSATSLLSNISNNLICIFPRFRESRRPDKNWSKECYLDLINLLQRNLPEYQIAICGAPGGSYFVDESPPGCIDLVNIDSSERTNLHAVALSKSSFALGSLSGAMVFARFCGVPVLTWGLGRDRERFFDENQLNIPTYYISTREPSVADVFNLTFDHIKSLTDISQPYVKWYCEDYLNRDRTLLLGRLQRFRNSMFSIFYAKNR